MSKHMHACGVHPGKERLACLCLPGHEVDCSGDGFVVDRLHALGSERSGVFASLSAYSSPMRLLGRVVSVGCLATKNAARRSDTRKRRIFLWPVRAFRFLLGVEVVKVAEEFVKAMNGGQVLVAIAQVILAEL